MTLLSTQFHEPQPQSRAAANIDIRCLQPQAIGRNEIHLWYADLDQPIEDHILSSNEEERARRFRYPLLRSRFRATRALTRTIIGQYLSREPEALEFSHSALGKPQLEQLPAEHSDLKFNLSHSGSTYLLGIGKQHEIGVDIERFRTIEDRDELVQHFFHPNEIEAFHQVPENEKDEAFLLAWTRKEAILKATGAGLTEHLDSLQVTLDPRGKCRLISIHPKWGATDDWNLATPISSAFSISSVATPNKNAKFTRHNLSTLK